MKFHNTKKLDVLQGQQEFAKQLALVDICLYCECFIIYFANNWLNIHAIISAYMGTGIESPPISYSPPHTFWWKWWPGNWVQSSVNGDLSSDYRQVWYFGT